MKKWRLFLLILAISGLVIGVALILIGTFKKKTAGLFIETTPTALVFINGEQVGRTPYEATLDPGEVTVKLVPESLEVPLAPFETKISLTSGIKTVIRREFGDSDELSSGEVISFEKTGGKEAGLAVVSIPDAAQISIDGNVRGFAPYKTTSLSVGEHQVSVSAPGYKERNVSIRTVEGYKLTVVIKLAPSSEPAPVEGGAEEEEKRTEVEILSTPTGFLRVRSEPSTLGEEIGRVEPGQRYLYLEEDEETGWFKIEYEEGKEGWVSNQYAKKVENSSEVVSPSPTPSPTPSAE